MQGLMQPTELRVTAVLDHAQRNFGPRAVVWRDAERAIRSCTYSQLREHALIVARFLQNLGIEPGDRVATLAWNNQPHLATWFGIVGAGAICHTVNPRMSQKQIQYVLTHAQDRVIFCDADLLGLIEPLADLDLKAVVVFPSTGTADAVRSLKERILSAYDYDDLLQHVAPADEWAPAQEEDGVVLCYTSGTTGDPKGVLYSHRSSLLMAWATIAPDAFNLSNRSNVLAVVPLFHANAWSLNYAAPMVGAKLVLPGRYLDGASVHELILGESVTFSAGVPTVWNALLDEVEARDANLGDLEEVVVGGAALPRSMIERFAGRGVRAIHAWGMTELNPLGTVNRPPAEVDADLLPDDHALKQGRILFGLESRVVDESGHMLPRDGTSQGILQVRGPWTVQQYLGSAEPATDVNGWFDTGDIATIDDLGFVEIADRTKDVIKSGGEWISSVALENEAMSHPGVAIAAVIAVPDSKWGERPLLLVVPRDTDAVSEGELRALLSERMAGFWLPERIEFVDEIPLGATGKIDKKVLRARYGGPGGQVGGGR